MVIGDKGKLGYITGKVVEPEDTGPSYEKWETKNLTVMSWLSHSMQPSISMGFLFLRTTKEIWDLVHQAYAQSKNVSRVYQLRKEISHLQQGSSL
ncbi:hypothetical protein AMTRI_Chr08g210550 [Amborella trichopoda]